jgi:hypothetical protein
MKFGIRTPSLTKRIAARTSWKRVVRHSMGFKAPRGFGWLTNPKRAAYNRIYNRTTVKADPLIGLGIGLLIALIVWIFSAIAGLFQNSTLAANVVPSCPRCSSDMVLRSSKRSVLRLLSFSTLPRHTRHLVIPTISLLLRSPFVLRSLDYFAGQRKMNLIEC